MAAQKKEISLLPAEEAPRLDRFLKWALSFGRWIVIATELIVILCFLARFKLDRDLTDLGERIRQQQAIIASFGDLEENFRNLEKRLATIDKLQADQLLAANLLEEIGKITPVDVSLSELTVKEKEIAVSALAFSEAGLGRFLKELAELRFKKIILENVSKTETSGIEFRLKAEMSD